MTRIPRLGATLRSPDRCAFLVWAPRAAEVEVQLLEGERRVPRAPAPALPPGYHQGEIDGVRAGDRYRFVLDGARAVPDPASRLQPEGVHGPSAVVALDRPAPWEGVALRDLVLYELHVGTFTPEGTFDAAIGALDRLADLGITAVEVMPVAHFPGVRNWGYDGVHLFAVHTAYGGPEGLRRFVEACHARGLACLLDVVYNHLGPEGNTLRELGPYFTSAYETPWGEAVQLDGAGSDEVREYFVQNALQWILDFGLDGLRLDAVHALLDRSAEPFLEELARRVHAAAPQALLIAESDANDPRLVRPPEVGGHGLDAVWADDLHHALHAVLTGERSGYYADFGGVEAVAEALRSPFAWPGEYRAFRGRRHGRPAPDLGPERFVVCAQNHDQVGNRPLGERLITLEGPEAAKLAAGVVLLAPTVPLLFMGEEYGEEAPFLYFVHHGDPDLVEAVRRGRAEEFAGFFAEGGAPPDPQAEETFLRSKLRVREDTGIARLTRRLLALRRALPPEREVGLLEGVLRVQARGHWILYHFGRAPRQVPLPPGAWDVALCSAWEEFDGPGGPSGAIAAEGGASLTLPGRSLVVLVDQGEPPRPS